MNWIELKKRYDEILRTPVESARETIFELCQELEQFALENLGSGEAKEADLAAGNLRNLLRNGPIQRIKSLLTEARVLVNGSPEDTNFAIVKLTEVLQQRPDNQEAYRLLIEATQNAPSFTGAIREVVARYIPSCLPDFDTLTISKSAMRKEEQIEDDKTSLEELLKLAEEAYYSGEWVKTISLCNQIVSKNPGNVWAKEHLSKAQVNQTAADQDASLPREAKQLFRRARSLILAGQEKDAAQLLERAIQITEKEGKTYSRAEELLLGLEQVVMAIEFKEKARQHLEAGELVQALEDLNPAMQLDTTDEALKVLDRQIKQLLDIQRGIKVVEKAVESADMQTLNLTLIDGLQKRLDEFPILESGAENQYDKSIHPWINQGDLLNSLRSRLTAARVQAADKLVKWGESLSSDAMAASQVQATVEIQRKAVDCYNEALRLDPKTIQWKNDAVRAQSLLNKYEKLLNWLNKINALPASSFQPDRRLLDELKGIDIKNNQQLKQAVKRLLSLQVGYVQEKWEEMGLIEKTFSQKSENLRNDLRQVQKIGEDFEIDRGEIASLSEKINQSLRKRNLTFSTLILLLLIACLWVSYIWMGRTIGPSLAPVIFPSHTPTASATATITLPPPTLTATTTPTSIFTPTVTALPTNTSTAIPTSTPAKLVYVTALINLCSQPNATNCIGAVPQGTVATVLDTRETSSGVWYLIKWEDSGLIYQGWIRDTHVRPFQVTPNP